MPKICPAHEFKPRQREAVHSTHTTHSASQHAAGRSPNNTQSTNELVSKYIERLLLPINIETLRLVVIESIQAIKKIFYDPALYSDAGDARHEADEFVSTLQAAPHLTLLATFFLLLNVDTTLKQRIARREVNKRKLTRFLFDLNKYAVSAYLENDNMSTADFVFLCEELYILA